MKTLAAIILFTSCKAFAADFQSDLLDCNVKTGKCERRAIIVHEAPLTPAQAQAKQAAEDAAHQARAAALANAKVNFAKWATTPPQTPQEQAAAIKDLAAQLKELLTDQPKP